VDVQCSDWDCTLERTPGGRPALRLGLGRVKGLSAGGGERIIAARKTRPFSSIEDLARYAGLARRDLECLAAAGALESLAGDRHLARWQVLGTQQQMDMVQTMPVAEGRPLLRRPTEGEDIAADYGQLGLTLGRHPLALLRGHLDRRGFVTSKALQGLPHGRRARTAGLVITRQRPGTATGVTFLTLEDEFGTINVVVWSDLAERRRALVLGGRLLGVNGVIQKADGVLHLAAAQLEDHSALLGRLVTTSRDFC
ncbi:MAG TPA: OB-fold nucleic acid binding domain-containing protein, partial [Gammaproteobacteria bacterium]|nr:OB-fold nucleic acid binding domain-containing protein [Gammaproteobacteria bacterium]